MKKLLQMNLVLIIAFIFIVPAQAQTLEERVTTLETQMVSVQQLSFDLATLLGSLQPDLVAILTALSDQQTTIATIHTDVSELKTRFTGVSRSGKTPTSIYMALQYGLYVANYPLTEDDLNDMRLPSSLAKHKDRLVGLNINGERLASIRHERRPDRREGFGGHPANREGCAL